MRRYSSTDIDLTKLADWNNNVHGRRCIVRLVAVTGRNNTATEADQLRSRCATRCRDQLCKRRLKRHIYPRIRTWGLG
jgi:hypothetical protein